MTREMLDEKIQQPIVNYSNFVGQPYFYQDGRRGVIAGRHRHEEESYLWVTIYAADGRTLLRDSYTGFPQRQKVSTRMVRLQLELRASLAGRLVSERGVQDVSVAERVAAEAARLVVMGRDEEQALDSALALAVTQRPLSAPSAPIAARPAAVAV